MPRLPVCPRLLQSEVDDFPAEFPGLRFERVPIPAEEGNRGVGKIGFSCSLRKFRDRPNFGPFQRGIGRLSIESLEGGDSHARILQDVVAGHWTHDYGVALGIGEATEQCDYRQPQSLFHWIPLPVCVASLRQKKITKIRSEDIVNAGDSAETPGSPRIIARPSPPSGWPEDFHLQAVERAQHTTKPLCGGRYRVPEASGIGDSRLGVETRSLAE